MLYRFEAVDRMYKRRFKVLFFILAALVLLSLVVLIERYFVPTPKPEKAVIEADKKPERVSNNEQTHVSDKKLEADEKLQSESDSLLPLFDNMPVVPAYIKDEPILKSGTNIEKGVAYTVCEPKKNPTIFVKKTFYQKANRKQIVNILKHELTPAWFCRQGVTAEHDTRFRKKFKEVGGFGN
jgi:hypothetical protein